MKVETGSSFVVEEKSTIDNRQSSISEESRSAIVSRPSSITLPLLLEVGCEEIPARFLSDAEKGLGERVQAALQGARLLPAIDASPETGVGAVRESRHQTYSTPRRLVVHVPALLGRQPDKVEEILGPPVKVAVGAEGNYTRAAESFAQKNSAPLEDLTRTTTPKGEYLALRKTTQGRSAQEILSEILPAAILGLSFPKSMYWTGKSGPRFVRPIRWVLAILGEGMEAETVVFEIVGVKSGDSTFGHRAKGRQPQRVTGFKDYMRKLAEAQVEIRPEVRQGRVMYGAQGLVEGASLKIVQDKALVDWIVNSTEWPRPIFGSFDERFLHLPREILITVMRDHQKYFAVENQQGNLKPRFVAVLNLDSDSTGLIRQGHERVLRARFTDAEFFWNADQRIPLRDRQGLLDRVTYHANLGTYGNKVWRMQVILDEIPVHSSLALDKVGPLRVAILLSKCDLTTQMVQEFPELQGVVGGLYAEAQGEPKDVSDAIREHYLPQGFEGSPPKTLTGALLSFIDKFDAVLAGFAAELEPKGSNDPFAMRRNAAGIIKVLLEYNLSIDLKKLIDGSYSKLRFDERRPVDEVSNLALSFIGDRLRYYLENIRGFRYDTVRAVLEAGFDVPADALARTEAMEALRGSEDFEALSVAAKRIRNILLKSASAADWQAGEVDAALLNEAQEKELHEAYGRVAVEAQRLSAAHAYGRALEVISTLRPAVDRFFVKVLVMAEDRGVRQNRLRLLKKLDDLFSGIAHFAKIEGQ
jgi:glycyl-tRNA synthetase beta chain